MSTHILGDEAPAQPPAVAGDPHRRPSLPMRWMRSFRHWRKGRPFVGGLLAILAGVELLAAPITSLGVMIHEGVAGFSASFFGPLLVVFGLAVWFAPAYRLFAGIATILLGLIALPTINLGGFFIGTLMALIGGGLSAAWTPRPGWQAPTRRERTRVEQTAETPGGDPDAGTMNAQTAEISSLETEPVYGMPGYEPPAPIAQSDPMTDPMADPTPPEQSAQSSAQPLAQPTTQPEADQSGSTEESGAHVEE